LVRGFRCLGVAVWVPMRNLFDFQTAGPVGAQTVRVLPLTRGENFSGGRFEFAKPASGARSAIGWIRRFGAAIKCLILRSESTGRSGVQAGLQPRNLALGMEGTAMCHRLTTNRNQSCRGPDAAPMNAVSSRPPKIQREYAINASVARDSTKYGLRGGSCSGLFLGEDDVVARRVPWHRASRTTSTPAARDRRSPQSPPQLREAGLPGGSGGSTPACCGRRLHRRAIPTAPRHYRRRRYNAGLKAWLREKSRCLLFQALATPVQREWAKTTSRQYHMLSLPSGNPAGDSALN